MVCAEGGVWRNWTDRPCAAVAYPGILFGGEGGFQQIQLRTEDGERGSGGVSPLPPSQGFWRQL